MLIWDHGFYAVFIRQLSGRWLSNKDAMKPVVADKHLCDQIYIKSNIYLIIII